jgi:diguanylate cyclase (GGDEF)-like protein
MSDTRLNTTTDGPSDEIAHLRAQLAEARAQVRSLQEKLDAALDGTGLCLWQGMPPTGELMVFNMQDFQPGEMAPHFDLWYSKLHPDDRDAVVANYRAHLAGELPFYEAEYRTCGPDGKETWLWDHGRVVERGPDGEALRILGTHVDITRRKEGERELERLAHNDPLTGLPNRILFFRQLEQALDEVRAQGLQLAVLFLDLDYFKQVNDQYGHAIGDRVLLVVAEQLQRILCDGGIVARLGGDEFTVLLKGASVIGQVRNTAEAILQSLGPPLLVDDKLIRIGASIGVSLYPEHGATVEDLVLHADTAMYHAKSGGRHRITYYHPGHSGQRHDTLP